MRSKESCAYGGHGSARFDDSRGSGVLRMRIVLLHHVRVPNDTLSCSRMKDIPDGGRRLEVSWILVTLLVMDLQTVKYD